MPARRPGRAERARPARAERALPRLARGFVYVLLLVVCTVTAAYGGYTVGTRTRPSDTSITTQKGDAVKIAVTRAVAAQKHADRVKRRNALRDFANFQRARFDAELQRKLDAQHITDGEAAARAYSRGQKAGAVAAQKKAAEAAAKTPDAVPADPANP